MPTACPWRHENGETCGAAAALIYAGTDTPDVIKAFCSSHRQRLRASHRACDQQGVDRSISYHTARYTHEYRRSRVKPGPCEWRGDGAPCARLAATHHANTHEALRPFCAFHRRVFRRTTGPRLLELHGLPAAIECLISDRQRRRTPCEWCGCPAVAADEDGDAACQSCAAIGRQSTHHANTVSRNPMSQEGPAQ